MRQANTDKGPLQRGRGGSSLLKGFPLAQESRLWELLAPRATFRVKVSCFPEDEVVTFFGGKRALIYHWNENPFLLVGCVKALPPQTWTTLGSLTHPPHLTNIYPATKLLFIKNSLGFPGGAVVENLPANAGDTGSSPGLGGSHMPRSN